MNAKTTEINNKMNSSTITEKIDCDIKQSTDSNKAEMETNNNLKHNLKQVKDTALYNTISMDAQAPTNKTAKKNAKTAKAVITAPAVVITEPPKPEPVIETDEDDDMEAYMKKQQDEMDALIKAKQAETDRIMKLMEAKKIAKSVGLLREQARDAIMRENERIQATIDKLKADIAVNNTEIEATMRGDFDEELIKVKTDAIKPQSVLPPTLQQKPVKNTPTADGARARAVKNRPATLDDLFTRDTKLRWKAIKSDGHFEALFVKAKKLIIHDGDKPAMNRTRIEYYPHKTITKADGKKSKIADKDKPVIKEGEWDNFSKWINATKNQVGVEAYDTEKNAWKEVEYQAPDGKWAKTMDYEKDWDGIKLN
jgi:hypothetical protein